MTEYIQFSINNDPPTIHRIEQERDVTKKSLKRVRKTIKTLSWITYMAVALFALTISLGQTFSDVGGAVKIAIQSIQYLSFLTFFISTCLLLIPPNKVNVLTQKQISLKDIAPMDLLALKDMLALPEIKQYCDRVDAQSRALLAGEFLMLKAFYERHEIN